MLLAQIKNTADDCKTTHRWAIVNLAGDAGNATDRKAVAQVRIIGIGRKLVRVMRNNGRVFTVEPAAIREVW